MGARDNWNKELEFGLPDARLSGTARDNKQLQANHRIIGRMWMEKVFCVNCGCDGGAVTPEWAAHIFYLCDECAKTYGQIDGAVQVPDEVVRGERPEGHQQ
jgi:hypothetical protein